MNIQQYQKSIIPGNQNLTLSRKWTCHICNKIMLNTNRFHHINTYKHKDKTLIYFLNIFNKHSQDKTNIEGKWKFIKGDNSTLICEYYIDGIDEKVPGYMSENLFKSSDEFKQLWEQLKCIFP